jgi:hypothetical protein
MTAGSSSKLTRRCVVTRSLHKAIRAIAQFRKRSISEIADDTFSIISIESAQRSRVRFSPEFRALLDELAASDDWHRTLGRGKAASAGCDDFGF